jgi:hypothetical protein
VDVNWGQVVTGVVGLAGIISTAVLATGGRAHDERMAKQGREAAHETWHREQRAAAYLKLLDTVEQIGAWVATVHPMVGSPTQHTLPSIEAQRMAMVPVRAFAARPVNEAYDEWAAIIWRVMPLVDAIDANPAVAEERQQLEELRPDASQAQVKLAAAINVDLGLAPDDRELVVEPDSTPDEVPLPARMLVARPQVR